MRSMRNECEGYDPNEVCEDYEEYECHEVHEVQEGYEDHEGHESYEDHEGRESYEVHEVHEDCFMLTTASQHKPIHYVSVTLTTCDFVMLSP